MNKTHIRYKVLLGVLFLIDITVGICVFKRYHTTQPIPIPSNVNISNTYGYRDPDNFFLITLPSSWSVTRNVVTAIRYQEGKEIKELRSETRLHSERNGHDLITVTIAVFGTTGIFTCADIPEEERGNYTTNRLPSNAAFIAFNGIIGLPIYTTKARYSIEYTLWEYPIGLKQRLPGETTPTQKESTENREELQPVLTSFKPQNTAALKCR